MSEKKTNTEGFISRELYDHKTSKLNRECIVVKTADLRGPDNAHHKYVIECVIEPQSESEIRQVVERCEINFQNGGLKDVGPNGITEQALIAIVIDRMRSFNDGPYGCRENSIMITKLEEALMWGSKRADDRARRNVEGERIA